MDALAIDFNSAPFLVIWETTRSCALSCRHCRAEAVSGADPRELDTKEGKGLLDQTSAMGTPLFILSGGDCLSREDMDVLIAHGKERGLRMGAVPAATPGLTRERIFGLKRAGLDQVAFSLDGPTPALHDAFRGADGCFAQTWAAAGYAREAGLALQINTCFSSWNFPYLDQMIGVVRTLGACFWEIFFLIPMGRGARSQGLSADQFEVAFERLHALSREAGFTVKLTEAPHYRRFAIRKELSFRREDGAVRRVGGVLAHPRGMGGVIGMSPQAVNAGKGLAFIDHLGNIFPSGFLPVSAGNVRADRLAAVYRDSPLFRQLRDPGLLEGKCGRCEFAAVCGGSRSRAYAQTGDYLAADASCAYRPAAW